MKSDRIFSISDKSKRKHPLSSSVDFPVWSLLEIAIRSRESIFGIFDDCTVKSIASRNYTAFGMRSAKVFDVGKLKKYNLAYHDTNQYFKLSELVKDE